MVRRSELETNMANTLLHLPALKGRTGAAELLLTKGASIEATGSHNFTPLHCAAKSGQTGLVELFLEKGASIEALDIIGNTPLHCAVGKKWSLWFGRATPRGRCFN